MAGPSHGCGRAGDKGFPGFEDFTQADGGLLGSGGIFVDFCVQNKTHMTHIIPILLLEKLSSQLGCIISLPGSNIKNYWVNWDMKKLIHVFFKDILAEITPNCGISQLQPPINTSGFCFQFIPSMEFSSAPSRFHQSNMKNACYEPPEMEISVKNGMLFPK